MTVCTHNIMTALEEKGQHKSVKTEEMMNGKFPLTS